MGNSYNINQQISLIGSHFDIINGYQSAGKISQQVLSWGKTFELRNENDQLVAKAKQQVFSLGVRVDVYDCQGQLIGTLEEDVLESLFKVNTVYSILNEHGLLVGRSRKLDWLGTDIIFFDASERPIATLTRPFFNWLTDKWTISIADTKQVDPRLMFFTAAYKTSADSDRKHH